MTLYRINFYQTFYMGVKDLQMAIKFKCKEGFLKIKS